MKHISILKHNLMRAAMTLALIMTCATAWAETVETYYIDENGTRHDVTATVVTTYMDDLGTDGETTWYVVNENVFLYGSNNQTHLHGNVNLIIADGCELKPACGSNGPNDGFRGSGNLTLYGQTASTGTLSCGQEGFMNITGDFTVCSGIVSVSGGNHSAIRVANFTMRGGSVSITNNTNNDCGIGATGTVNIYSGSVVAAGSIGIAAGTVNIYGGSVTAMCNGGNAEGSNYGRAIKCSSTFNFYGGNVTVQGDYNWHEGQTRYGIHAGSINLSWTSIADWIYNTKDGNFDNVICYFAGSGSMNIAPYKPFTDGTTTYTGTLTDEQVEALADKTLQPVVPAFADSGDGTPEHPYTIYNATGWGEFCDALQDANYNHFSGKTVKLGANISVTQSAGSNDHRFMGTFDGQEHTLDVDITDTGEQGTAPFRFISNATIRNLHVTGTVTGTTHAAGLVGKAIAGTILIENCLVETNVNSTVGNNRHCGGIVGHGFGGNNPVDLTLRNCVYAGTITCDKNYIGGLQGWSDGNTLTLENCLFAGNYQGTATGTAAFHPIALHNTGSATNLTATNVFAAVAPTATNANFIAADGTKTTGRTTAPAGLGTQGATYSFMDMTVYENGLYYNGLYYVAPTLSTDNSGAYLINNEDDWDYFCDALYNNATWNRFSGQTVKLGADISVSRMAGYDNHDFLGTFDGNHDTLTFTATATASYLAPFRNVLGNSTTDRAVIRDLNVVTNITAHDQRHMAGLIAIVWGYVDVTNCNVTVDITATKGSTNTDLYPAGIASQVVKDAQIAVSGCTVDGTISTDGKYAGGIIGIAQGSASITNSLSSVTINSSTDGDGTHGGFVGVQGNYDGKTITIEGCVFNGSLLGASTHSCGGFLGWRSQTVTISNSLFAPVQVTINTTDGSTPCATFVRNGDSNTTITNCYYTDALGTAQGTQVYSISKGEYVTTLEINGTANPSYTVSGLSFYSTGIKCGDVLFAEANDVVSLILAHQDREGYDFIGYTATAGNLNGSSLTMPDGNVTINAEYTCTAPSELTATDITATTATLNWNGLQESYSVRYHRPAIVILNEGFESGTMPDGWTRTGSSHIENYQWQITSGTGNDNYTGAATGNFNAGCYINSYNSFDILITPVMDLGNVASATLSFNFWNTDWSGDINTLKVYYRVDRGEWHLLYTYGDATDRWIPVTINLEGLAANYQIGFECESHNSFGMGIDDVMVIGNGAWTTENNVLYPFTLTGLTPETPYQWQVQGLDCDGNDGTTEWSAMGSFTTLSYCSAPSGLTVTNITPTSATLSWSGYQDSYVVQYRTADVVAATLLNEGFEGSDYYLPDGWTSQDGSWFIDNSHVNPHSGTRHVINYQPNTYLSTPMMDLSGGGSATLNFWYINDERWNPTPAQLDVYYRINGGDWTLLWSSEGEHLTWTEATISLPNPSANYQIGFRMVGEGEPGLALDDIVVTGMGGGFGEWQNIVDIEATTTTLTGLTPDMPYQWQVRGLNCDGNNGATEWSAMGTFTTLLHDPVAYIDENGDTQQCTDYTPLTGTETTLTAGWYVADGTLNYDHTLILSGDVHLILKDGAVMNVGTEQQPISGEYGIGENGSLHIYGQSAGSGHLYIYCEEYGISVDDDYEQNGGNVTISAGIHGIFTGGDVTLRDGTLSTIGDSYYGISGGGNVNILGGKCTAKSKQRLTGINANSDGSIILGWKNTDDYIDANGYALSNSNAVVQIADGQLFIDEDGNTYSGIIERDGTTYTYPIDGKKLLPYIEGSVPYLDMNGRRQLCTEFTTLDGSESTLTAGWYVADGTLDYDHTITLSGDIHLILKDNAVMNVTSTEGYGFYYYSSSIPPSISIYAQSTGESKGQLHVDASVHGLYTRNDITINGGWVEATSNQSYGIFASSGNVIINGGIVEATGGVYGIFGGNSVEIHGGEVTAIGPSYGINAQPGSVVISGGKVTATATNGTGIHARYSITISGGQVTANGRYDGIYTYDGIILGWTNASDFIYASSFYINNSNNYITLSKAFKDVDGNTYESGPVNASAINGKTLYPEDVILKHINGYGEGNGGWVFIASPVAGSIAPSEVHNLIATTEEDYDLYRFNQSDANGNEWQNWKATTTENHPDFTSLVNGQGYLYATKETRTLVFAGEYTAATEPVEVPLAYDATAQLKGWNLVGNPFTVNAILSQPYYRMNAEGSALKTETEDTEVAAMEGVFVKANENGEIVTFGAQTRGGEKRAVAALYIQVGPSTGSGTSVLDNAIIRFDGGQTLEKFSFREGSTKLYIPQDGKDYAIAFSEGQGEMALNFKAKENGTYTLTINPEGVEMAYLHLIDNMTGADIDLLSSGDRGSAPAMTAEGRIYTFEAKVTDYESRFRLVFKR